MTKITKKSDNFLQPLKAFEQSQNDLVKNNPFISIIDTESFETAKKSRTALLKGRTELQNQQKEINSSVNALKTSVKEETERLIDITLPAEQLQQHEVKRYENIQETRRIEREEEKQKKIDEAKGQIDAVIEHFQEEINELKFEDIGTVQEQLEDFYQTDTSKFEDLEMYFSGQIAIVKNSFMSKIKELKQNEELKISQAETKLMKFVSHWQNELMSMTFGNMNDINTEFDTKVPEINSKDFYNHEDEFIKFTKNFRDRIGNRMIELRDIEHQKNIQDEKDRIQQEKDDAVQAKEDANNVIRKGITEWFDEQVFKIELMTLEAIIRTADDLEYAFSDIRQRNFYNEFKDLIELKIVETETLYKKEVDELVIEDEKFKASEKIRLADEKIKRDNEKKELKKKTATEKKRQTKLKPFKDAGIKNINTGNFSKIIDNAEIQKLMDEFIDKTTELKDEYIKQINNL